jgi:hypothetical protein
MLLGLLPPCRWPLYLLSAAWSALLFECSDVPHVMMRFTCSLPWLQGQDLSAQFGEGRWPLAIWQNPKPVHAQVCRLFNVRPVLFELIHLTQLASSMPVSLNPAWPCRYIIPVFLRPVDLNPVNITFTCKQDCWDYLDKLTYRISKAIQRTSVFCLSAAIFTCVLLHGGQAAANFACPYLDALKTSVTSAKKHIE